MDEAPVKFTRLTGKVANVAGMLRLKRLGKIRLGIKKKSLKTGNEYPEETDYFVCPPEVCHVYGERPTVLDGLFLSNDPEEIYQEKLALYGNTTGLKCHGNGETAMRRSETGKWEPRECPCEFLKTEENPKGQCGPQAHLMVMLPKVDLWGYYQITTRGINSRVSILRDLKQMQDMLGRIARVPITLTRVPQDVTYKGTKKTHHIVTFKPAMDIEQVRAFLANPANNVLPENVLIEAPVDESPHDDPPDLVVENDDGGNPAIDAETLADLNEAELTQVQAALKARAAQKAVEPSKSSEPQKLGDVKKRPVTIKPSLPPKADQQWTDTLLAIESFHELIPFVAAVKQEMRLPDMNELTPTGRSQFLEKLKDLAHAEGVPVPF